MTLRASLRIALGCSLAVLFVVPPGPATGADWTNWRGPAFNHSSAEKNLVERWNPKGGEGSNLLWKSSELAGRSTPIVMEGRLYTLVRDRPGTEHEGEKVVCADAATGQVRWEHRFNVYLSDVPDTRVGGRVSSAIPRRAASTHKGSAVTSAASKERPAKSFGRGACTKNSGCSRPTEDARTSR